MLKWIYYSVGRFNSETTFRGDEVETNEKTFRYSHIFKNLGVLYLIFLIVVVIISLVGWDPVFLICIGSMVTGGLIFMVLYRNTSVSISEVEVTAKTILGTKSLNWSEIGSVSSRGTSLNLHSRDDGIVLTINPRLDGAAEISERVSSKRVDLFENYANKPILHSNRNIVVWLSIGLLLIILSILLYIVKDYVFTAGFLGLFFWLQAVVSWYSSPRRITLESNNLVVHYVNKSISIAADDIVSVQIGKTKQGQVTAVYLVFPNRRLMEISGYKQSPFIIYPVLKKWHETYAKEQPASPA